LEKYGFVYLWFDRKHKKYYVGSHWGHENDGYVCSSKWMRNAYSTRKVDFKRKILERVYSTRMDLLKREEYYLSLIKTTELRIRYYNISKSIKDPWFQHPTKIKTVSEKISIRTKEAMQRPEVREKYKESLKTRDNKSSNPEVIEKRRLTMIKTMAEKFPEENRRKALTQEQRKEYYSDKAKFMHASRTDEQQKSINLKISEANKRNVRPDVICPHCEKSGNAIVMKRWHFDKCKFNMVHTNIV
jgi:hypothetical protein